jgi:hypothetical protein
MIGYWNDEEIAGALKLGEQLDAMPRLPEPPTKKKRKTSSEKSSTTAQRRKSPRR